MTASALRPPFVSLVALTATLAACTRATPAPPTSPDVDAHAAAPLALSPPAVDASVDATLLAPAAAPLHLTTAALLRALAFRDRRLDAGPPPAAALFGIAPEPGRFNDGNLALARHLVSREACMEGLRRAGVTLQTAEQRASCRGRENMVPIVRGRPDGSPAPPPKACIDVFEYPNVACELPFVWGTPVEAEALCRAEGKRLCTQPEWTRACAADPAGGPDRLYAYGDTLDLAVCNTNRPHPFGPDGETWRCSARTAQTAWETCATETEPAGAFPACRSRMGVFDQHGNVAEIMSRAGEGGEVLTQLKGSAFFYVDVARAPTERQKPGGRETYPDTCAYDPRWHVEELAHAMHSNYHLGFRCCLPL